MKIVNCKKTVNYFCKTLHLDVRQGSVYASDTSVFITQCEVILISYHAVWIKVNIFQVSQILLTYFTSLETCI